jgi:hypothetical protein
MTIKLNNALTPFQRADQVEINCGNDWYITIRQAAIYNQEFRAASLKYAGNKGDKTLVGVNSPTGNDEKDYEFFCEILLVGWRGLTDDDGKEVPYSKEVAIEIFKSSKQGKVLFHKLLRAASDDEMFSYEDEVKNS